MIYFPPQKYETYVDKLGSQHVSPFHFPTGQRSGFPISGQAIMQSNLLLRSKARRSVAHFGIGILALSLVACNPSGQKNDEDEKKSEEKEAVDIPVNVAIADQGEIASYLEFDSVLETESAVKVFPESIGLVVDVLAEVGDPVEHNQVIAQLENEEQQVNLREALSRYKHLQSKFERTQDLYDRNLINQQEYDTEVFDLEQAEIAYERARLRLEDTIVRAPVSGVVSERSTQVGKRVTESSPLFSLLNTDDLFAMVNVPGQHAPSIRPGLNASIESEIIEGVSYPAQVKLVSPAINSTSGTMGVKVSVNTDHSMPIYPGMFVSVKIILDTKEGVVLVPKSAIVHEGERTFIFKVEESIAQKQPFEFGYSNEKYVESLGGIESGDSIIVLGHSALKDGAKVNVVTQARTTGARPSAKDDKGAES